MLSLAVLAVAGTNILFRTQILRRLVNEDPSSLAGEWSDPHAWIPGRIGLGSLTLRSRDHNIEWEARLENVEIEFSLIDLVRKRFHTTHVRAGRLVFRLRERLRRDEATPELMARYPRIRGFADPPLLENAPVPSAGGRPWRVLVDDIAVEDVTQIWIDAWRWEGSARLRGGFELLPGHEAEVFSSDLDVVSGEIHHGSAPVTEGTRGVVSCAIPRFDTQAFPGNDVWKLISGFAALRARLSGVSFLSSDGRGVRFAGGAGDVRFGVALADTSGRARLTVSARDVRVQAGARRLRGSVRAEVHVPRLDFGDFSASFNGSRVTLRDISVDGAPARAWSAELRAPAARLDMNEGGLAGHVDGRFADARPIVALLPPGPPKWVAGLLDLSDLSVSANAVVAPGVLEVTAARAAAGTFELSGDYRERGRDRWGAFLVRSGILALGVGVTATGTALHPVGAVTWFENESGPGGLRSRRSRSGAALAAE
jgi:hypothetical protein